MIKQSILISRQRRAVQTGKTAVKYMSSITHLSAFDTWQLFHGTCDVFVSEFTGAVCLTACVEHMEIKNDQNCISRLSFDVSSTSFIVAM